MLRALRYLFRWLRFWGPHIPPASPCDPYAWKPVPLKPSQAAEAVR